MRLSTQGKIVPRFAKPRNTKSWNRSGPVGFQSQVTSTFTSTYQVSGKTLEALGKNKLHTNNFIPQIKLYIQAKMVDPTDGQCKNLALETTSMINHANRDAAVAPGSAIVKEAPDLTIS